MRDRVGAGARVRREMSISLVFAFLKILSVFLVIRLADASFAAGTLGIYLLARRLASTVPNLSGLGVGNALQRYLPALASGSEDAQRLLRTGFALVIVVNAALVLGALAARETLTGWLFPDDGGYGDLPEFALWVMVLFGLTAVQFAVNGALLGRRRVFFAQLGELLAVGGWQLLGFAIYGDGATPLLLVRFQACMMMATGAVALPVLYVLEAKGRGPEGTLEGVEGHPLLVFGPTRAVVNFLDSALITLGPWILRSDPEGAGALIIGLTVLRAAGVGLTPLSKVAGVAVAELEARRSAGLVVKGVGLLVGGALLVSSLTAASLFPVREVLVGIWLADAHTAQAVSKLLVPLLIAVPATGVFLASKVVVDVRHVFPLNAVSLGGALVVTGAVWWGLGAAVDAPLAASWAVAAGYIALAGATVAALRPWLPSIRYFGFPIMLGAVGLAYVVSLGCARLSDLSVGLTLIGSLVGLGLGFASGTALFFLLSRKGLGREMVMFVLPVRGEGEVRP